MYNAIALSVIISMIVTPILHTVKASDIYAKNNAKRIAYEQEQQVTQKQREVEAKINGNKFHIFKIFYKFDPVE